MSTRDRILDAAARVMTERGIAATTTRAIAAAAGCSEALLYKHFDDKQQIFLAVLLERMPTIGARDEEHSPATTAAESLAGVTRRMFDFFLPSFPMAVSIFGTPELLAEHRQAVRAHGYGPEGAVGIAAQQLERDRDRGILAAHANLSGVASVLVGVAFHQAFLAAFDGRDKPQPDAIDRAVATVLPFLEPGGDDA